MFCVRRKDPKRRGKRSTRSTDGKRKRRQRHTQTLILTSSRSFMVLSSSWQFTSSVISVSDFETSPSCPTLTHLLELSELSEERLRGGLKEAATGPHLLFVFTTMLLEDDCSLGYTQLQDRSYFHCPTTTTTTFPFQFMLEILMCWALPLTSLCMLALSEWLSLPHTQHIAFLVARWGCCC